MSTKLRSVDTHFWQDNWISDCDPIEKLLFLYLLTNPLTNMLGIYEMPLKRIAFDTGIDKEMVIKLFARFEDHGKAAYLHGFVVLFNFTKHQKYNTNMLKSASNLYIQLNTNLLRDERVMEIGLYLDHLANPSKPFETLSKPFKAFVKEEIEKEIEKEVEVESEIECEKKNEIEDPPPPQKQFPPKEITDEEIELLYIALGEVDAEKILNGTPTKAGINRIIKRHNIKSYRNHFKDFLASDNLTKEKKARSRGETYTIMMKNLDEFSKQIFGAIKEDKLTSEDNFWGHFNNFTRKIKK